MLLSQAERQRSPALASFPFDKIHSSYLYLAKWGPLPTNPACSQAAQNPGGRELCTAIRTGYRRTSCLQASGNTQLALQVLSQTAHAGLSLLDTSKH